MPAAHGPALADGQAAALAPAAEAQGHGGRPGSATTGPAMQPRPTSSTPAIKFIRRLNGIQNIKKFGLSSSIT